MTDDVTFMTSKALLMLQRDGIIFSVACDDGEIRYLKTKKQFDISKWPNVDPRVFELAKNILGMIPSADESNEELDSLLREMERDGEIVSFRRNGEICYRVGPRIPKRR